MYYKNSTTTTTNRSQRKLSSVASQLACLNQSSTIGTSLFWIILATILATDRINPICQAKNVAITNRTVEDWNIVDLAGVNQYKPNYINRHLVIPHDEVSNWPVNTYYWQAPEVYYDWKIYTYGGDLQFLINHIVTRGDTSGKFVDEPDLVLEGGPRDKHMRIGYKLVRTEELTSGWNTNQTIKMPLTEPGWYYINNMEDENGKQQLRLSDIPVSREDFSLVLAGLDRSLIRAKYHMDQVEGALFNVDMNLLNNKSRTDECNNDCSGLLLDDLDEIGLLFDEILRLAPELKNGPLKRLAYLQNRANKLAERLLKYLKVIDQGKELVDSYMLNFSQETIADILYLRAKELDSRAPTVAYEAHQAKLLAQKTLDSILNDLWDKIRKTIKALNEHGFGPSGLSPSRIERILQESEMILRELKQRNLKPYLDDAERELRKAKALLDRIRNLLIDPEKSAELLRRIEQLTKTLLEFSRIVQEQVLQPVQKSNDLVQEGRKKYQAILDLLKEANSRHDEGNKLVEESKRLLEITKNCLSEESTYLDQLPRQLADLNSSTHDLEERRSILSRLNPEYQKKYVDKCREHGDELLKKSKELDGLFNSTRDVADYAMRAANAYKLIVASIRDAEKAAKRAFDAAEKAYKQAVPDFDESLVDKAKEAKRKSLELLEKAKKLRDQDLQRLSLELEKNRRIIEGLFDEVQNIALALDAINAGLKQLAGKNLYDQLQEIDNFLRKLLERIAGIHKRLQLLADLIYNTLLPQFERLTAGSQSSLGNLSLVLDKANKDLQQAIRYSISSNETLKRLLLLEEKLDLDLDLLKRKIQLGHQESTSVHVSVMPSSESNVCTRSYFIPSVLSGSTGFGGVNLGGFILEQLTLIYSTHGEQDTDALLMFIGSKVNEDYLAVEMIDRHIRVLYNLGSYTPSGYQVLTHPMRLTPNDNNLLDDELWYKIQVNFTDDSVRLSVKSVPHAKERDTQEVRHPLHLSMPVSQLQASPYGEANLHFYVGGLPETGDSFKAPKQIESPRLTGCLYDLALNGHQVGLWNFKTNQGCQGCMEGAQEPKDPATFSFSGMQSYAMVAQSRLYDPSKYSLSMNVRTQDQNSLLFLALGAQTNDFLSIQLKRGRVVYSVGKLLNQTLAVEHNMTTSREYNSGRWFKITAEKELNQLVLSVEDEFKETTIDERLQNLEMDQVFFGGVWPMLLKKTYSAITGLEFDSFSGCMKDIQIESTPIGLLRKQSYGVALGCQDGQTISTTTRTKVYVQYPLPAGRR